MGVRAGLSVLESSILGAITLLAVGVAAWAVWHLSRVQNARVADLERWSERMESLMRQMTATFADVSNSLDNLVAAERDAQQLLQGMKNSLDTVIMDAIRRLGPAQSGRGR